MKAKEFLANKFLSRKFFVALSAIFGAMGTGNTMEAIMVAVTYLLAQGAVDTVGTMQAKPMPVTPETDAEHIQRALRENL